MIHRLAVPMMLPVALLSTAFTLTLAPRPAIAEEGGGAVAAVGVAVDSAEKLLNLAKTLHETIDVNRELVVSLKNDCGYDLVEPKTYLSSGKTVQIPLTIPTGQANVLGFQKADGSARGAVGVVTYLIKGTNFRLAIYYQVPYDYNLYENRFKVQIFNSNQATDQALFKDMAENNHRLTLGDYASARSGSQTWSNLIRMTGLMTTGGDADMTVELTKK